MQRRVAAVRSTRCPYGTSYLWPTEERLRFLKTPAMTQKALLLTQNIRVSVFEDPSLRPGEVSRIVEGAHGMQQVVNETAPSLRDLGSSDTFLKQD